MTPRACFPLPASLAADTDFHSLSSALGFTVLSVSLLVRQGQRRDSEAVPALEALIKRSQEVEGGGFTSGQVASFAQAQVTRLKQAAAAEKK